MKEIKNWIPVMILFFLSVNLAFAQSGQDMSRAEQGKKRLKAQRVAFITERLDLTPEEAENFWPLHNQFENDKKTIGQKYKRQKRMINMTDKELEEELLNSFKKDQELLDLKKSYFQEFKKVLSVRKIAMLSVAEKEFRRTIVEKVKERRQNRRQNRGK